MKTVRSTHGQSVNFEYIADKNPDIILVITLATLVQGTNTANAVFDNDLVNGTMLLLIIG